MPRITYQGEGLTVPAEPDSTLLEAARRARWWGGGQESHLKIVGIVVQLPPQVLRCLTYFAFFEPKQRM